MSVNLHLSIRSEELQKYIDNSNTKGYWGEHPDYSWDDWRLEVMNNDTRQGYWEWCYAQQHGD